MTDNESIGFTRATRLTEDELKALKRVARCEGRTDANAMRRAVQRYVAEHAGDAGESCVCERLGGSS